MKKIMANDKLAEMAMSDPKRVKRILANRQWAARSKERKMRYIVELEHKVQTLQTEATTLSAQLTLLQRDMMGLTNQNNELKFRLQAMEQQARLRDALNEALNGEVQRLKVAIRETLLPYKLGEKIIGKAGMNFTWKRKRKDIIIPVSIKQIKWECWTIPLVHSYRALMKRNGKEVDKSLTSEYLQNVVDPALSFNCFVKHKDLL